MQAKDFTISYNDEELLKNLDMEKIAEDLDRIEKDIESGKDKGIDFDTYFEEFGKKLYGCPIQDFVS